MGTLGQWTVRRSQCHEGDERTQRGLLLPMRTVLLLPPRRVSLVTFREIGDTFLIVFIGVFLALCSSFRCDSSSRRLDYLAVGRDWCSAPARMGARDCGCCSWCRSARCGLSPGSFRRSSSPVARLRLVGDSGAAENVRWEGDLRKRCRTRSRPCSIAGGFFSAFLVQLHDHLHLPLPALTDVANPKRAPRADAGEDQRWLGVWERVTTAISQWAIGVVIIAVIAGTTNGHGVGAGFELGPRIGRHQRGYST